MVQAREKHLDPVHMIGALIMGRKLSSISAEVPDQNPNESSCMFFFLVEIGKSQKKPLNFVIEGMTMWTFGYSSKNYKKKRM